MDAHKYAQNVRVRNRLPKEKKVLRREALAVQEQTGERGEKEKNMFLRVQTHTHRHNAQEPIPQHHQRQYQPHSIIHF